MTITILPPKHFTIADIKENLEQGKFDFNDTYQRSDSWSDEKKQKLLDSILRNLSIGVFFIKEKDHKYEVLDGQQRIKTLGTFFRGEILTSSEQEGFREKSFDDLKANRNAFHAFMNFKVWYIPVAHDGSDQELADIFLRLQEGTPLNSAERLNAMFGNMRNTIVKLSEHAVFKRTPIQAFRFAHRLLAAQFTLIELESDFVKKEFPNIRFKELAEMYEDHKGGVPKKLKKRIVGTLDFLEQSLGEDMKVVKKKSDFTMLYGLASYVRRKYVIKNLAHFGKFITNFFTEVELIDVKDQNVDSIYKEYKILRRAGSTSQTLRRRFDILLKDFNKTGPRKQTKDPQRFFNWGQKLEIYYKKDNKICRSCGKHVKWNDATFDHIKRYELGGKTIVENGRLLHKKCHLELEKARETSDR